MNELQFHLHTKQLYNLPQPSEIPETMIQSFKQYVEWLLKSEHRYIFRKAPKNRVLLVIGDIEYVDQPDNEPMLKDLMKGLATIFDTVPYLGKLIFVHSKQSNPLRFLGQRKVLRIYETTRWTKQAQLVNTAVTNHSFQDRLLITC